MLILNKGNVKNVKKKPESYNSDFFDVTFLKSKLVHFNTNWEYFRYSLSLFKFYKYSANCLSEEGFYIPS